MSKNNTKSSSETSSSSSIKMEGSAYTGKFNLNAEKAANFMECIEYLGKKLDGFEVETVWSLFDNMSLDERKSKVKKQKKRLKVKEAKFKPDNLVKPKKPINLFREDYRKKCESENREYNNAEFMKAWHNITDNEKYAYLQKYDNLMEEYRANYFLEKQKAIDNGDIEPDLPKKNLGEYIIFTNILRLPDNIFLDKDDLKNLESLKMQDEIKYFAKIYKKYKFKPNVMKHLRKNALEDKERYDIEMYLWNVKRLEAKIKKTKKDGEDTSSIEQELDNYLTEHEEFKDKKEIKQMDLSWAFNSKNKKWLKENDIQTLNADADADEEESVVVDEQAYSSEQEEEDDHFLENHFLEKSEQKGGSRASASEQKEENDKKIKIQAKLREKKKKLEEAKKSNAKNNK